ncbi:hypothetical protein SBADM41S_10183 [Streptomyces badius]
MIPAHYLAGSVDVLAGHVYYWRVREGSITRRRTDVTGVRDRIAACEQVSAFLGGRDADRRRAYDASCLRDDFGYFLDGLPMGGEAYRAAFLEGAGAFVDRAGPGVLEGLPVELRIKWRLVRERRLAELLEALAFERANGTGTFAVEGLPGRRRAVYPGVRGASARLTGRDVPAVARLLEARWGADGKLRLRGYAYLRNLPAGLARRQLTVGMVRAERGRAVRPVPVRPVPAPEATVNSGEELHDYDHAGFEMVLDPDRLPATGESGGWLVGPGPRRPRNGPPGRGARPGRGRGPAAGARPGRRAAGGAGLPGRQAPADGVATAGPGRGAPDGRHRDGGGLAGDRGMLSDGTARATGLVLTRECGEGDEGVDERLCAVEHEEGAGSDGLPFTARVPLADLAAVPPATHHRSPARSRRRAGRGGGPGSCSTTAPASRCPPPRTCRRPRARTRRATWCWSRRGRRTRTGWKPLRRAA